ncbi:MAG: DUF3604 domain-containing protein, partial [Myxococcota bacterium]
IVAGTDTHLASPGMVDERTHPGHGGGGSPANVRVPPGLPDVVQYNPGGLTALWAEENSRDALFAAMRRREAYGTSGPRIETRFFGGWGYASDLCDRADFVEQAYAGGTPMGGDLPDAETPDAAPTFVAWAKKDAGTIERPGTPLQRLQIIKGWLDGDTTHERVFDVAGDPNNDASVDEATCEARGAGFDTLCTVWSDADFDSDQPAFYYLRVVENPTCRWTTWTCNAAGVDCADPSTIGDGLDGCCDSRSSRTIHERAWTSPIWFEP